ncbi:Cof-type HAD-IIB family hydrolase [Streptomyces sp. NPDC002328]|uniref:Cof-type HAD-IIB family hydrolase n=1 Tax=Streptomyces sp. NPDC002328 TaxID=3364642 RepID=UPI00369F5B1C
MPYSDAAQLPAPEPSAESAESAASAASAVSADIRLIVTDMDGTLLDDDKRAPEGLREVLALLRERGVLFSPASGRQYATLAHEFDGVADGMVFIAENGTYVVRDGEELSCDPMDPAVVAQVVESVRRLVAGGADVGAVVCGKRSAYVERTDDAFLDEVRRYYLRNEVVDDVSAVDDDVIKVALYDFGSAERITAPALAAFAGTHRVVVSGEHWVDVMNRTATKGAALSRLQRELGITPAQTMVFGDYLNDLEMLDVAEWSFAMANAHPEVVRRARHLAPSNNDNGVLRTIVRLLDLPVAGL